MKIVDLRQKIDVLDKEILNKFVQRFELSSKVADIKNRDGLDTYDEKRELEMRKERKEMGKDFGLDVKFVDSFFELLLEESRRIMSKINKK